MLRMVVDPPLRAMLTGCCQEGMDVVGADTSAGPGGAAAIGVKAPIPDALSEHVESPDGPVLVSVVPPTSVT